MPDISSRVPMSSQEVETNILAAYDHGHVQSMISTAFSAHSGLRASPISTKTSIGAKHRADVVTKAARRSTGSALSSRLVEEQATFPPLHGKMPLEISICCRRKQMGSSIPERKEYPVASLRREALMVGHKSCCLMMPATKMNPFSQIVKKMSLSSRIEQKNPVDAIGTSSPSSRVPEGASAYRILKVGAVVDSLHTAAAVWERSRDHSLEQSRIYLPSASLNNIP